MYTLKLDKENKIMIHTTCSSIFQGENLSDKLVFLLPQTVGDVTVENCKVYIYYVRPDGVYDFDELVKEPLDYKEYHQYHFPITSKLTAAAGNVKMRMQLNNVPEVILRTAETTIEVLPIGENKSDGDEGAPPIDDALIEKINKIDLSLKEKVDKVSGSSLVENSLIEKLRTQADIKSISAEFILNEAGQLEVQSIDSKKISGLSEALATKLTGIKLGDSLLDGAAGVATIPIATSEQIGVVRSTSAEDGVFIAADGAMNVNCLNVNKLVQSDHDILILDGGDSTTTTE